MSALLSFFIMTLANLLKKRVNCTLPHNMNVHLWSWEPLEGIGSHFPPIRGRTFEGKIDPLLGSPTSSLPQVANFMNMVNNLSILLCISDPA
jgi:hypothetical protein